MKEVHRPECKNPVRVSKAEARKGTASGNAAPETKAHGRATKKVQASKRQGNGGADAEQPAEGAGGKAEEKAKKEAEPQKQRTRTSSGGRKQRKKCEHTTCHVPAATQERTCTGSKGEVNHASSRGAVPPGRGESRGARQKALGRTWEGEHPGEGEAGGERAKQR